MTSTRPRGTDASPAEMRSSDVAGASCGGCARRWSGFGQAHCPTCHAHFGSVFGFDVHRVGGVCRDPATLVDRHGKPVLVERTGPFGSTWVRRTDRVHPGWRT